VTTPADLDADGTFRARMATDRMRIAELWDAAEGGAAADADPALAQVERLAHRLAGAGGTFGYAALSEAAFAAEDRVAALRREPSPAARADAAAAVAALLDALAVKM
jgi:HPt (histidine-containing phosphotransfer) domain-containing protein